MPKRKGSSFARALFNKICSPTCIEEWKHYDLNYFEALNILTAQNSKIDLLELDVYVHETLLSSIRSRNPPHLLHAELAQIMKWKLTRGKFRPLQKLVESNTSVSVIDASSQAFQLLLEGKWEDAFDAMTQLRGVGVATASAIFSILAPDQCPFMADEVLEGVTSETREYSMRAYTVMRDALIAKAVELQEGWTADRVGRALWTCAIINASQPTTSRKRNTSTLPSNSSKDAANSTPATTTTTSSTSTSSTVTSTPAATNTTTTNSKAKKRKAESISTMTTLTEGDFKHLEEILANDNTR
jgi:hypothetical protein